MEAHVVEIHNHVVARKGDDSGFYCTYVYLDGTQCSDVWFYYPHLPMVQGTRVMTRDAVSAWVRAGGQV